MTKEELPEAEYYPNPERDDMETLVIEEDNGDGKRSFHSYAYNHRRTHQNHSQAEKNSNWTDRLRSGLFVRLTMAFIALVCGVIATVFFFVSCVNGAMALLTLLQNPLIRSRAWSSFKMTLGWCMMTGGALVAMILPSLGVGLMMAFLMLIDENSPLREMLRQRLHNVR